MNRNYFCSDCNLSTQNPRLYLEHRRDNHGESISIYKCDFCIYATKHSTKLIRHRRTVHRDILANFSGHNLVQQSAEILQQQQQQQQQQIDTFDVRMMHCTLCEFCCINKMLLIDHFRTAHPTAPIYQCDQCSYSHFIKEKFKRHQRYHSLHCVQCHICEFKTIYRWNLDRHMRHHNDEAVNGFRCRTCNFIVSTRKSITDHETNHHGHGQIVNDNPVNATAKPMEPLSLVDRCNSNENENTTTNDDENEQTAGVNDLHPMNFLKLVWEGIWNAAKENGTELSENIVNDPIAPIFRSPLPSLQIFEYYFQCRNCHFRNEININDLSKNQNHSMPEKGTNNNNNNNNDSLNENTNIGPSYRCGYCHQSSNWKHVIERHCRLVHKSDAFVERFSAYEKSYRRLMPSVRRLKERPPSLEMQMKHEQQ